MRDIMGDKAGGKATCILSEAINMKWKFVLAFLAMAVFARSAHASAAAYQKLTAAEAREMMAQSADYVLLDVRSEGEYKEKRIEGAALIPVNELASRAETELPDKGQLILVYCRSGGRSERAARALVALGYTNVYDFGGINDWPYETVSG